MGALYSTVGRRNGGVEVVDIPSTNAYKYPPKSGNFFGSHFVMGGERFDMSQPEAYLFGENSDLNFLGSKPVPFPYQPATGNEPTKTLKSLVNIRKDTLRLVRIPELEKLKQDDQEDTVSNKYNIEFVFDCDVKCTVQIMYFCTEEISNNQISYPSRIPAMSSDVYHYKRGASQTFQQSSHVLDPSSVGDREWMYLPEKEVIPVVIQCVAEDDDGAFHAHMTLAVVERSSLDGCYIIKPLKQKQFVHGLCYLLQEIYGIENKNNEKSKEEEDGDDDIEDSGAECVICMSDMRDTLILPCRHLCLCSTCAESLRYQASSCPICRSPFRALLQIRAMRKKQVALQQGVDQTTEENAVSQEGVPQGYEAVSLIEALNGPCGLPPPNTMEGIHVPPPSRFQTTETDSHQKRRSGKKHSMPVETVKEMLMTQDDKKIPEEKDGERTDTSVKTESSVPPSSETPKTPPQKNKLRSNRHKKAAGGDIWLPRSPSLEKDKRVDTLHVVDERDRVPGGGDANVPGHLPVQYAPLTVSSENLADDEREDTSEGEPEPEPDFDQDDDSPGIPSEPLDSITDDLDNLSVTDTFTTPPDYSTVMSEQGSITGDTEMDTDDGGTNMPVDLHLSSTEPHNTDSSSSQHSSHALLHDGQTLGDKNS